MTRNIALCFDGTWNTPDDDGDINGNTNTNVRLFYEAIAARDAQGQRQLKWYDKGVGTKWYNKLRGGIFGCGLSENIKQGYRYLVDKYEDNDEIYITGYSRGAYTARSLVGMIRNCGLIDRDGLGVKQRGELVEEAYQLYRSRDEGPDTEVAQNFRTEYSRRKPITIRFLGLWDTVGALGVPLKSFDWFNRKFYEFHDTELSSIVQYAYHALAVDEHREDFAATMWDPKTKANQEMKQMWFVGAHGNVGGGIKTHTLSGVALRWIVDKASGGKMALAFSPNKLPVVTKRNYGGKRVDSFAEFFGGVYRITHDRYLRSVGNTPHGSEEVHESVVERYRARRTYRPKNPVGPFVTGPRGFDSEAGRIRG